MAKNCYINSKKILVNYVIQNRFTQNMHVIKFLIVKMLVSNEYKIK